MAVQEQQTQQEDAGALVADHVEEPGLDDAVAADAAIAPQARPHAAVQRAESAGAAKAQPAAAQAQQAARAAAADLPNIYKTSSAEGEGQKHAQQPAEATDLLSALHWGELKAVIALRGSKAARGDAAKAVCLALVPQGAKSVALIGNGPLTAENRRYNEMRAIAILRGSHAWLYMQSTVK